jgi:hypothetical protein
MRGQGLRVTWRAVDAETNASHSYPYYQAASAYRAAERESVRTGRRMVVTRDGQPYKAFENGVEVPL